jgi:hypothetical protein
MGMTSFCNWIEAVKKLSCPVSNFHPWLRRVHECGAKAAEIVYAPTGTWNDACVKCELQLAAMCGKAPCNNGINLVLSLSSFA